MSLITAITLAAFVAAPVPMDEPPKDDKKEIQGEWKMVEFIKGGDPREKDGLGTVTFKGDQMTINANNGKRGEVVRFTLDAKANPPVIDLKPADANAKVNEEKFVKGIYKLEKDKLTICFGLDATGRPKEFKSEKGSKTGMFVLERVKK